MNISLNKPSNEKTSLRTMAFDLSISDKEYLIIFDKFPSRKELREFIKKFYTEYLNIKLSNEDISSGIDTSETYGYVYNKCYSMLDFKNDISTIKFSDNVIGKYYSYGLKFKKSITTGKPYLTLGRLGNYTDVEVQVLYKNLIE